ncbi:putative nucleoside diphosphate hydrolase [Aureococcus anophagefferens virus]|uniref:Putative nucleoside diphosphate hydrolase n=1 Tax=Aureococcus anophagefferens virus TaxID=1474867 RepID=A0A076FH95_9VIRU|nr:putative nucleoside diphosphate hydrolase [Aureococcus anophagefferens virus]AII17137.1 putative nucleoside diphosphate hydrolase [Aureococcus anophagefferens virus]UOG94148.1 hypothetical protein MKD35_107 [Aureococcus anophagefferens virus]
MQKNPKKQKTDWSIDNRHKATAAGCVFNLDGDKVLLVQDKDKNITFPKGYIDKKDEVDGFTNTTILCAKREVKEETNVDFQLSTLVPTAYTESRGKYQKHVTVHIGIADEDNCHVHIQNDKEENRLEWAKFVPINDARKCLEHCALTALEGAIVLHSAPTLRL